MRAVTRPPLRWLGGKFRLARKIIPLFPPHRIYLEPYGGAGSVLWQKPRAYNEIWNDLDGELVNLFQVLRGDRAAELLQLLYLTPYSRAEYLAAFEPAGDPVERARRMLVRSHLAHGTGGARIDRRTGFRSDGKSATTNVAGEWADFPDTLQAVIERVRGVNLEQVPALDLIARYDDPKALIYLDPPYVASTRSDRPKQSEGYHTYNFEMTDADHVDLLTALRKADAMCILSGYASTLYDDMLQGWERIEFAARAHRNAERTEVVWINPPAVAARGDRTLFDVAA